MRGLIGSQGSLREQQKSFALEAERLEQEREAMLVQAAGVRRNGKVPRASGQSDPATPESPDGGVEEAADALARVDAQYRSLAAQRETAEVSLKRVEAQASTKGEQLRSLEKELSAVCESSVGRRR